MSGGESYKQKSRGCGYNSNGQDSGNSYISRSRALGVIALMLALFIFQVTVFIVNSVKEHRYKNSYSQADVENNPREIRKAERFEFDPNTISLDSLCLLGFSPRQAQTILNYRSKGGVFRKREDFARMYVVNDSLYNELSKYIVINSFTNGIRSSGKIYGEHKTDDKEIINHADRKDTISKVRPAQYRPLMVELNSADSSQLVKLYGIGGYYAKRIIAYRERIGKFYTPEQLMEIEGIDSLRYSRFAKNVNADPAAVKRFRLDTAGKHFLIRHPYIGAYAARGIILLREKFGAAACTLPNLVKEKILTPAMAEKLWYYILE